MRLRWVLLVLLLSVCAALIIEACARTNAGGGTVTTTVPSINCPPQANAALLAGDFIVASTLWGNVQPVGTCTMCDASPTANYYPDSGIDVPAPVNERAIGGVTCANLCVCSSDGTCYTRTTQDVNIVLYPFCNAGTCAVYAVVVAQDDAQGITDGTNIVTAVSQIDPNTLDRLPITSGNYPEVSYASCSGCTTTPTCG